MTETAEKRKDPPAGKISHTQLIVLEKKLNKILGRPLTFFKERKGETNILHFRVENIGTDGTGNGLYQMQMVTNDKGGVVDDVLNLPSGHGLSGLAMYWYLKGYISGYGFAKNGG